LGARAIVRPTRRRYFGGEPVFVLRPPLSARRAVRGLEGDPGAYWHRPIIIRDPKARLGMSSG
jgi:hypothetical protein